jgi:hypothetical protein
MGNIHRRGMGSVGCMSLRCTSGTIRPLIKVCSKARVQSYKQYSRIWRPHLGTKQTKGVRSTNTIDQYIFSSCGMLSKERIHGQELEVVRYLALVRALEWRFQGFTLKHIPRLENSKADELAKATTNNLPMLAGTFYQVLMSPATQIAAKAFQTVLLTECED